MVEEPIKFNCETELLLDYRFNETLFHSINYDPDWSVLTLGTNRG